ncbi:MAG: YkgJ family cysteine cluster protein [Porticoccus sp.]|nr:YkgJ family cysteine cluster protein [Porticoccus sp.]
MKECNQCGKCCINYSNDGLSASASEIDNWEMHRPDIYRYVSNGHIWMHPDSGEQLTLCPWLKKLPSENKYTCDIYFDRPDDCKYYPVTIEDMIKDECEMLEAKDLAQPKQAQKALNKLMDDSRHSFE